MAALTSLYLGESRESQMPGSPGPRRPATSASKCWLFFFFFPFWLIEVLKKKAAAAN